VRGLSGGRQVAHQQDASRTQHPRRLARIARTVARVDVVQAAAIGHEVDARVGEGQVERVAAEVEPGRPDPQLREEDGVAAGAAAHVERRARQLVERCEEHGQLERRPRGVSVVLMRLTRHPPNLLRR
jgi:hypothetical protein